jgi:3-oxoadipate enol-lactonase/4-carboxymuconolactone decarboxylase
MIPTLTGVTLVDAPGRPLLVVGPSLGTSVETLWSRCTELLGGRFHVVGWDLPGHGRSTPPTAAFTMTELAEAVRSLFGQTPFLYAGDSIGGAVGLSLLLQAPDQVTGAVLVCTGAKIGSPAGWHERAAVVRASGTAAMIEGSAKRWFAPGFLDRAPTVASSLLHALRDADAEGYALACEALASFDVRDRLGEIATPVLAIAGAHDVATPPAGLKEIATGVRDGRLAVLDDVGHLAPAERPDEVAALVLKEFGQPDES